MTDEPDDLLSWWGEALLDPLGSLRRAAEAEVRRPRRKQTAQKNDQPKEWHKSQIELADYLVEIWEKDKSKAASARQAVLRNAKHWVLVLPDGSRKEVNAESCWRSRDKKIRG